MFFYFPPRNPSPPLPEWWRRQQPAFEYPLHFRCGFILNVVSFVSVNSRHLSFHHSVIFYLLSHNTSYIKRFPLNVTLIWWTGCCYISLCIRCTWDLKIKFFLLEINNISFSLFWLLIVMMLMLEKTFTLMLIPYLLLLLLILTYSLCSFAPARICYKGALCGNTANESPGQTESDWDVSQWGEEIQWITVGSNYKKVGYFWILRGKASITFTLVNCNQMSHFLNSVWALQSMRPFQLVPKISFLDMWCKIKQCTCLI